MSTQNKHNPLVKAIRNALLAGAAVSMAATGSVLAEDAIKAAINDYKDKYVQM